MKLYPSRQEVQTVVEEHVKHPTGQPLIKNNNIIAQRKLCRSITYVSVEDHSGIALSTGR